jgi:lysozyme family protein
MKENFEKSLELVLQHEGGYVHHPLDPGGRTNLGVTQRVWEDYVGHQLTKKKCVASPKNLWHRSTKSNIGMLSTATSCLRC